MCRNVKVHILDSNAENDKAGQALLGGAFKERDHIGQITMAK